MKKHIIFLLALFVFSAADAQILDRYKRNLNSAEKRASKELQGGADFVLDPIETVPRNVDRHLAISAQTNWGKELLLPDALRQRMAAECTYKVTVKVADTGQPDHVSLRQGQLAGKNYTTDQTLGDGNGHSTHVLGIIAGDEIGVLDALVDKGLVRQKAVKILTDAGSGSFDWFKNAVAAERAEDAAILNRGEFVVWNGSFGGGTGRVASVETELQKSTSIGVVFCFAAGNTGGAGVNYPGNGAYSIACASLDQTGGRSSYSTTGPEVWAAMPGRNINSTYKGNTWATLSGTSMATPFLTAAVAVGFSKWGNKMGDLQRVRSYIAWCSKDITPVGKDDATGWGINLIQNILDRDPGQTPGLPDNPPPPPPPPGDGMLGLSPITISLAAEFPVLWSNVGAATPVTEARTFKTAGRGSRKSNQNLALTTTKARFVVRFSHDGSAGAATDKAAKEVAQYFVGRGFLLPVKQDESYAVYWAAYFLEMGLAQDGFDMDVIEASYLSAGQTVKITDLKHWPVK